MFGRVLLIAQEYDQLVGGYSNGCCLLPRVALKTIYSNQQLRYDTRILDIFIRKTNFYKIGETFVLPNSVRGVIIGFADYIGHPCLPILRLEDGAVIDLMRQDLLM